MLRQKLLFKTLQTAGKYISRHKSMPSLSRNIDGVLLSVLRFIKYMMLKYVFQLMLMS